MSKLYRSIDTNEQETKEAAKATGKEKDRKEDKTGMKDGMDKREKVIEGLEKTYQNYSVVEGQGILTDKRNGYEYAWIDPALITNAIALLKAQQPRLITNADFENKDMVDSAESMPAWIEYRHGEEWDEYNDGNEDGWSIVYQFNFESEFYRCWTSRPTAKNMGATPWEG